MEPIYRTPNTSGGIVDYPSESPHVSENESCRNKNVARKKTSPFTPYNSYLSQINVKPIDQQEIATIQCDHTKKEISFITLPDSDDELYMWVDEPVVVDLVSSDDENSSTHDKKKVWETNLKNLKDEHDDPVVNNEQGGPRQEDPVGTTIATKVNIAATGGTSDTVSLKLNDIVTSSPSITVAEVNATETRVTSGTVSPELNNVVATAPLPITAVEVNAGATGETSDTVSPVLNIVTSPSCTLRVHKVESLYQAVSLPHSTFTSPHATVTSPHATVTSPHATVTSPHATVTSPHATVTSPHATVPSPHAPVTSPHVTVTAPHGTVTSPTYSTTSPDCTVDSPNHAVVSSHKVDLHNYHVITSGRTVTHTLKRSHDVSESRDIDYSNRCETNKSSIPSERYDIVGEDRRKKIKLLAGERFYDASASRDHSKNKNVDRQTFATSSQRKSNFLTSKKDTKSSHKRLHNDTNDRSRHSRTRSSSPIHSRPVSSTIQRGTAENQKTCEGSGRRDSVVEKIIVNENKSENLSDTNSGGANKLNNHTGSSDNQRFSRPFHDYRWETILISKENARPLLSTETGYNFLNDAYEKYRVQLRMNWAKNNHILWICGCDVDRTRFNNALAKFFERATIRNEFESQSTVNKGSALQSTVSKGVAPQSTVSKDSALQSNVSKGSTLQSTVSKGFAPQLFVNKDSAPQSSVSKGSAPQSTVNKNSASQSAVSNGFESQSTVNYSLEKLSPVSDGFEQHLPKKKFRLIYRIEEHLGLLKEYLGNPEHLLDSITKSETFKTKGCAKRANRLRKDLNIILMGQAGLRDGPMHLASLERYLQTLLNITDDVINKRLVAVIEPHFNYIFSSYKHQDYPALIAEYKTLGKSDRSSTCAVKLDSQVVAPKPSVEDSQQPLISNSTESSNNSVETAPTLPQ